MTVLKPGDEELEALAREIHGMWHAGADPAEAIERLKTRLSRGKWDQIPRVLQPLAGRVVVWVLDSMWGAEHCGPDHEVVICDEPAAL